MSIDIIEMRPFQNFMALILKIYPVLCVFIIYKLGRLMKISGAGRFVATIGASEAVVSQTL